VPLQTHVLCFFFLKLLQDVVLLLLRHIGVCKFLFKTIPSTLWTKKTQVKICALKLNSGKQCKMPSRAKSIYEHIMLYSWTYHFPSDLVSTKFSGTYHCPSDLIEDYLDEWKWHTKGLTNHNDHSGCGKTLYLIDKPMTIA
jgi:hypothetical protein